MKGLFRRASTLPAPGNRSRGGGGAQPTAGHTMPLCAGHLGRLPWPPATVPTPGWQPGSGRWGVPVCQWELGPRDGQGCRWVEGTGMLRVPPAPGNPDQGSRCPSSPRSPCPVPAGCPQPVLLPPTAPTGLASPEALERGRTHGLSLLGGTAGGPKMLQHPDGSWQSTPWVMLGGGVLGVLGCCRWGGCPDPMGDPIFGGTGRIPHALRWLQSPALVVFPQEAGAGHEGAGSQPAPRPQDLQQTHPLRHRLPGVPGWPGRAPLLPPHPQEAPHRRGISR